MTEVEILEYNWNEIIRLQNKIPKLKEHISKAKAFPWKAYREMEQIRVEIGYRIWLQNRFACEEEPIEVTRAMNEIIILREEMKVKV